MNKAKGKLLGAMLIFGTVGIFVHYIPLPSATIAFCRAVLGCVVLLAVTLLGWKKLSLQAIGKHFWLQQLMDLWGIIGSVLILGSALYSELKG